MQEELDGRPAAGHQAPQSEGDERSDREQAPEDGPADIRDHDRIHGPGSRSSGSVAERPAAGRPTQIAVHVEAIEQIVEGEATELTLRDEASGEPDVDPQKEEGEQRSAEEAQHLRAEPGPEDVGEADAAEPDGVGGKADGQRE
jgi:hypothetical protein